MHIFQIGTQDFGDFRGGDAEFVENLNLLFEDGGVPAAREEAGVGAEEDAINADRVNGALKDGTEIEGFIFHPFIAAGGIDEDVGAEVGEHEGFAEEAGAEVWDDEADTGEVEGDGVEIERIGVAKIELAGEAEFVADTDAKGAAMNEDGEVSIGGEFKERDDAGSAIEYVCMAGKRQTA